MKKIVFFPTNNIGKYDRYKKSFKKKNIIYNRYLTDENGIDTVYFSFTDSGKKETYYSSYKDDLTIKGIYWGYEKNN